MPAITESKASFLSHYEPLHERFVRYCHAKAYGLMDAEDLVQEAILQTLRNWHHIRDKDRLLGYLMGTVNNLLRNQGRRNSQRKRWESDRLRQLENDLGDSHTALDIQYLLKALEELPTAQADAIRLFELSGFSVREIAQQQGVSEGAVKTRLSRGRQRLRELLREDGQRLSIAQRLRIYASLL